MYREFATTIKNALVTAARKENQDTSSLDFGVYHLTQEIG